jgi:hypothetical protein
MITGSLANSRRIESSLVYFFTGYSIKPKEKAITAVLLTAFV